jgi:uncharacterized membrane protein YkvA (DUF1232 family)
MAGIGSMISWPSLIRTLVSHLRLSVRLVREPRVPLLVKSVPVLMLLYIVLPFDLLPDFIPLLGEVDDLGVFLVALGVFVKLCPADAVEFHRRALAEGRKYEPMPPAGRIIDAEFRHEKD